MCTENTGQIQQSSSQQPVPSTREQSVTGQQSSETDKDIWSDVSDPKERRKIQNKLAQRRLREHFLSTLMPPANGTVGDKIKEQKEEAERELENRQKAGSSYAPPDLGSIDTNQDLSGLPWGGFSMSHIAEQGKRSH